MRVLPLLCLLAACKLPSLDDVDSGTVDTTDSEVTDTTDPTDTVPGDDTDDPDDTDVVDDTDDTVPADTDDTDLPADTDPPLAPADDPSAPGPYATETDSGELVRSPGIFGTRIPVQVTRPDAAGSFPVILLLHGFQLGPDNYDTYRDQLATWGYVVVAPELPGTLIAPRNHADLRDDVIALLDWIDTNATRPQGPLGGIADATSLGVVGHSMGGKIAILAAADDARIDTAVLLDPVDSGPPFGGTPQTYPSGTPEQMGDVQIPLALLGETTNGTGGLQPCAPVDENFHQYFVHAVGPTMEYEFVGANHMSFLDDSRCLFCLACPAGTDDPAVTRDTSTTLATAWFEFWLRNDARYRPWVDGSELDAWEVAGLIVADSANMP